uniref:Uncharacterized protein n=1 Tax=Globisporangium ultimum (strain ATCC 200006 / CBS 805.95 / DAOM BR144) TaxID=431595 RepID=K3WKV8_GLOUD
MKTCRRSYQPTCRSLVLSTTTMKASMRPLRHRSSRTNKRCRIFRRSPISRMRLQRWSPRNRTSRLGQWMGHRRRLHQDRTSTSHEAMCRLRRHHHQAPLATTIPRPHHRRHHSSQLMSRTMCLLRHHLSRRSRKTRLLLQRLWSKIRLPVFWIKFETLA